MIFRNTREKKIVLFIVFALVVLSGVYFLVFRGITAPNEERLRRDMLPVLQSATHSDFISRLVNSVTSGFVEPDSPITVKFNTEVGGSGGRKIDANLFTFRPAISGTAQWKDPLTLEFRPDKALPTWRKYTGSLALTSLLKGVKDVPPLSFSFYVTGQEILEFKGSFVSTTDRKTITYKAGIETRLPVSVGVLRQAVKITGDGREISLKITGKDRAWSLVTPPMNRNRDDEAFRITIDKSALALREDFISEFTLASLHTMKVVGIRSNQSGSDTEVNVEFSDNLAPNQDWSNLVRIEPQTKVRYTVSGTDLIVRGDFDFSKSYRITVKKGIGNTLGFLTTTETGRSLYFEDVFPSLSFDSDGVFLPSSNRKKIRFRTMNARKVYLEVKRVYANNLCQFLQTEKLGSDPRGYYQSDYLSRVGTVVARKWLEIGNERNTWLTHEVDLAKIMGREPMGLFVVYLAFDNESSLFRSGRTNTGDYGATHPNTWFYYNDHCRVYKPVVCSDIGLLTKFASDKITVWGNNLLSSNPEPGVTIRLISHENQELAKGTTNARGQADFPLPKGRVFYIEGTKSGQRSVITMDMRWNNSTFETKGLDVGKNHATSAWTPPPEWGEEGYEDWNALPSEKALAERAEKDKEKANISGTDGFIYTDRGVYRPGDIAHIGMIFRNPNGTFPVDHPVLIRFVDPRGKKGPTVVLKKGQDGFYAYAHQFKASDMTGVWKFSFVAGGNTFHKDIRVETVAPERLRVNLALSDTLYLESDKLAGGKLHADWLFGTAGKGLPYRVTSTLSNMPAQIPGYKTFTFDNQTQPMEDMTMEVASGNLNDLGDAALSWILPGAAQIRTSARVVWEAQVTDTSGRPTRKKATFRVEPHRYYLGIEAPGKIESSLEIGKNATFRIILANRMGNAISGKRVSYKIYRMDNNWWWDYRGSSFGRDFRADRGVQILKEGDVNSQGRPVDISFVPSEWGRYLIEVSAPGTTGHTAGVFFNATYWGNEEGLPKNAGVLTLSSDKKLYFPGDIAHVRFPAPKDANILVTLERGDKLMKSWWTKSDRSKTTTIDIPVTTEMTPNVYCTVTVIQPHAQTDNDRPIRLWGVLNLEVVDPKTVETLKLTVPEVIRPGKEFSCTIQTADRSPTQFTIAVVDEGLLSLTDFETPNAWQGFYSKLRLGVVTYDLYSQVIGAMKGDIFKTFSVGGDGYFERKGRLKQLGTMESSRFKPVTLFRGPVPTDKNGRAVVKFIMPDYFGAVRVMVISANKTKYGSVDKTVPVKTDLMAEVSLPRVLAPGDRFDIPVTVFALKDGIGSATVEIATKGPLHITGPISLPVSFPIKGSKTLRFAATVPDEIGNVTLTVTVKGKLTYSTSTQIAVRAANPAVTVTTSKTWAGKPLAFKVPVEGYRHSGEAWLLVSRQPVPDPKRLAWLIRYPYGCLEQTVSAGFPQLFLKAFMSDDPAGEEAIDKNIVATIDKVRDFSVSGGGFSVWPGGSEADDISDWVGHFLVEAKQQGYFVPEDLYRGYLKFAKARANAFTPANQWSYYRQAYRLFVLARAGEPQMSAMNIMLQNHAAQLQYDSAAGYLLQGAYALAGQAKSASKILKLTGNLVMPAGSGDYYRSKIQTRAVVLECLMQLGQKSQAELYYRDMVKILNGNEWLSTHAAGWALLAVGHYREFYPGEFSTKSRITGKVQLPGGATKPIDLKQLVTRIPLGDVFGKDITVTLDRTTGIGSPIVSLETTGIPKDTRVESVSKGLEMRIDWRDDGGREIDPGNLRQGQTFWCVVNLARSNTDIPLSELALTHILPGGWEIENIRLSGDTLPEWLRFIGSNTYDYVDFRDDRALWFFDMNRESAGFGGLDHSARISARITKARRMFEIPSGVRSSLPDRSSPIAQTGEIAFALKLRAVTPGTWTLPPMLAETMYDNAYQAIVPGKTVKVLP